MYFGQFRQSREGAQLFQASVVAGYEEWGPGGAGAFTKGKGDYVCVCVCVCVRVCGVEYIEYIRASAATAG
jgi:hypothetical protein